MHGFFAVTFQWTSFLGKLVKQKHFIHQLQIFGWVNAIFVFASTDSGMPKSEAKV